MYAAEVGRFASRDPLGYEGGHSLYAAYFAPNKVDPLGTDTCSCCNTALQDAKRTGLIPDAVPAADGKEQCPVRVRCNEGCPHGSPAFALQVYRGGRVTKIDICFDCRMSHENLQQTIVHEIQHARDYCRFGYRANDPLQCLKYEGRACDASCRVQFPAEGRDFDRCKECCVYFSCRQHHGIPKPSPPCDLSAIPTRPCWKYDPRRRKFVWDRTDPRCAENRRRR